MKPFLPFQVFRAGLFSDVSAWDSYSLHILDFVELRVPPLISYKRRRALASHSRKSFIPVQPRGLADAFSPAGADRLLLSEAPRSISSGIFSQQGVECFTFPVHRLSPGQETGITSRRRDIITSFLRWAGKRKCFARRMFHVKQSQL